MGKQEGTERQEVKQICVILAVGRQIMNTPWFGSGEVENCILLLARESRQHGRTRVVNSFSSNTSEAGQCLISHLGFLLSFSFTKTNSSLVIEIPHSHVT